MSMFKTLAPFASESPVSLLISAADGDKVRVFITQKKEDATNPLDLVIVATPDELDAQLPLAIADFMARPDTSVADQVKAQKETAEAKADADEKPAKKSTSKPAAKKPAAKKITAKLPAKKAPATPKKKSLPVAPAKAGAQPAPKAKPTKAERKAARSEAAAAIKATTPQTVVPAHFGNPAGTQSTPTTGDALDKADAINSLVDKRAACLTDLRNAIAAHGPNVTRRQFAALSNTGRSFERLFGSWEKFRAALGEIIQKPGEVIHETGDSSQQMGEVIHAADDKTLPLPGIETPPAAPAPVTAQPITASLI